MENPTCKTYFAVLFPIDQEKNIALLKQKKDCSPEELGICNQQEVGEFLTQTLGVSPVWNRHHFVIGYNDAYHADVNEMLRITLKGLFGKEDKIKEMQTRFGVTTSLEIVPTIVSDAEQRQNLSLDPDITDFLYSSATAMDLDYYVI